VTFIYEREGKNYTVVMDKFEFIHSVIKHMPEKNFKMVRYFGIHARRAKKSVREVMEKLGKVIKYLIKPFSWRKNVKEYTGKDPKNRKNLGIKKRQEHNTVSYVCSKCGAKEEIPVDVLEYFDEINPEQLLFGSHQFKCENCENGVMRPEREPEIMVKGFGLYEGIEKKLGF